MTPYRRAGASRSPAHPGRQSLSIGPFEPELGGYLPEVSLTYETWGELDETQENAVLIVHALTGDSHAAGAPDEKYRRGGWWDPMIGPGRPVDTDKYFVICSNVLGGCSGSTGPASEDPETGYPYAMRFPVVTIRDMVRAQKRLLDRLGVRRLAAVAGGSIGGQQALEWAVEFPDFVRKAAVVAANGALGPQGLGMSEIGRRAIMADPDWQYGDYYGTGRRPDAGLAIARMAGMMTYQSAPGQWERFGRRPATRPALYPEFGGRFEIESYLHYQGRDLVNRFDANSYLYLTRAMDLYDVGAGYASHEEAYSRIRAEVLFVGISSDWLFPASEVRAAAEQAKEAGADAAYAEIESMNGHDSFLKDWDQMRSILGPFLSA
ncbi:homoserine O-acetyltransferase [Rubrobacter taiwanensis]|jgi:homoserine O-acetyltransferase|uniref:Homoserine O-acetyltransferase n=1 Tax=Rubrobacter taiwanensis TaxID=185139 RepID=A0A4R1BMA7_9ACTN|nr:homoserine O-acetyltransferase [Rubrobacter taiwanensis]TCJ18477.1 homoserine O-acetyltransferase [Rubrobacter taiwanensis]